MVVMMSIRLGDTPIWTTRSGALKSPLTDLMRELTNTGRLFEVGPVDAAIKKLDHLENRVRFASYGYSGFFDVMKIEQPQLDLIYRFDLSLVEHIDNIETKLSALKTQAANADGLKAGCSDLVAEIDPHPYQLSPRREQSAINWPSRLSTAP